MPDSPQSISASDYTKITLETILKNIHTSLDNSETKLRAEIESILAIIVHMKPLNLQQLKVKLQEQNQQPANFSPKLKELIQEELDYIKANKLYEIEPTIPSITSTEKLIPIPAPAIEPTIAPFDNIQPD